MKFTALPLSSAYVIEPTVYKDERGSFFRFYSKDEFQEIGHDREWVQLNHSITTSKGTIRGMHYQQPPFAEIKLVRCIAGSILDIIIDLRENSSTFLQYEAVELSSVNRKMLYIPEGFAHGFQTLDDDCEMIYLHTAVYNKEAERGIRWDDPLTKIAWPLPAFHISERDKTHSLLSGQFKGIKL